MPSRVDESLALVGDEPDPAPAIESLVRGGLVAFPTETLWGVAADARSVRSVAALRKWKGRAVAHPIAVLVTGLTAVERLGYDLGLVGRRLAGAFWPGPLTLVAPATEHAVEFAPGVAGDDRSVGFRCSSHPAARSLARAAEQRGIGPLTATSLNRSGAAAASDLESAAALCASAEAPMLWPAGGPEAGGGGPSTVVDLAGPQPRVLRPGAIANSRLMSVIGAEVKHQPEESRRQ